MLPLVLAMTLLLAACSQTPKTLTGATDDAALLAAVTRQLCAKAWRPVTYSSRDTEQTQREARANNAARDEYCGR
jgi:starvation-inducible outer membrane lipoprotein